MLDDICLTRRLFDRPLEYGFMDVVSSVFAGLSILPAVFLRKHSLPVPLFRRFGVFSVSGMGHHETAPAV